MKRLLLGSLALATAVAVFHFGQVEAKALRIAAPPRPSVQAAQADVIILGKVIEIEKDTVQASSYKNAPKEQKTSYKIAVVKIEDPLVGARGLTQIRVGFLADAAPVPVAPVDQLNLKPAIARPLPGRFGGPVSLAKDMEGVFMLTPHHEGDFYTLLNNGAPLLKKDEGYDKELDSIKKIATAIDDPIVALKSKEKADRSQAVLTLLTRYRGRPVQKIVEEDVPAEENTLLLKAISEMSWLPEGNDYTKPSLSSVWHFLQAEKFGFKAPVFKQPVPGAPPVDFNKQMEEAVTTFLKDNIDKIKIKRFKAGS